MEEKTRDVVNVRLSVEDGRLLDLLCQKTVRNRSDMIRALIREANGIRVVSVGVLPHPPGAEPVPVVEVVEVD
jgi:hypothetical protein